VPLQSL